MQRGSNHRIHHMMADANFFILFSMKNIIKGILVFNFYLIPLEKKI